MILMLWGLTAGLLMAVCANAQPPDVRAFIERLAKEADLFDKSAHRVTGVETLRQHLPRGSRVSKGKRGVDVALPEQTREIVSEYGFVALDERGGPIKEVRSVLTVDGSKWRKGKGGLDSLARTLSAADDRKKRSLLESFEDFGLQGFVTDLGQLILLFSRGLVSNYEIRYDGNDMSDPLRPMRVYQYSQLGGSDALTIYEGKMPLRLKLQGKVWARPQDNLPVKISIDSTHEENDSIIRDISVVEYEPSQFGFLLPKKIRHQQFVGAHLFVQDDFSYDNYRQILSGSPR